MTQCVCKEDSMSDRECFASAKISFVANKVTASANRSL